VKRVYLHWTIAMSNVHWTSLGPKLGLKVVFLFQSFLVITVVYQKGTEFLPKLKISYLYIFATWCFKSLIFYTLTIWSNRNHCLKYLRSGYKDIWIFSSFGWKHPNLKIVTFKLLKYIFIIELICENRF